MAKTMVNRRKILFFLLFLIPPLWVAILVGRYGITVPFQDAWELVPLLEKIHSGTLAFSDLWAQHNEHPIFFPRVIMLALAQLTGWDIRWELIINFMLASLTLLVFCHLLRQTFESSWPWLSILFSGFIFSPVQWENFSWGWQIQIFLSNLAMVVAVWSVTLWPGRWRGICVSMGAALIASYSFGNGLMTWVVVLFLILQRERNWKHAVLVGLAFTAVTVFYTLGYKRVSSHPNPPFFMAHPFDFIGYVLIYLGSPLGFGRTKVSIMIGLLALALAFAGTMGARRFSQKEFHKTLPWQALALYGLLSALANAVGRAVLGFEQALSSRYTTLATPFLVSALVITILWLRDPMGKGSPLPVRWKRVMVGLSVLLAFSFVLSFSKGEREFVAQRDRLQWALVYLEHPDLAPDEFLRVFYPEPEVVRERAKALLQMGILKKIEWSRLDRLPGGNIRIDSINDHPYANLKGEVVVDPDMDAFLRLRGWAVDEVNKDCGKRVYVVFAANGKEITFPAERTRREDVAMRFGAADYYRTGWSVWASAEQFGETCYSLSVRMLDSQGKGFYEMKEGRLICFSRGSRLALRNLAYPSGTELLRQETQIHREKPANTDPYQAVAYSDMAGKYLEENRLEEAMHSLRRAFEIDPACGEAYYNLGKLYYRQHRLEESLAAFQRTIEIKPGYFAAHYGLGLIFLNKNMLKESEGEFKKALALNPPFANTLFNLGVVNGKQGRVTEAEEWWLRTLKVNPEHTDAQINLAIAYYNRRDFTRAKVYFMNLRKKGMSIDTRILRELDIP